MTSVVRCRHHIIIAESVLSLLMGRMAIFHRSEADYIPVVVGAGRESNLQRQIKPVNLQPASCVEANGNRTSVEPSARTQAHAEPGNNTVVSFAPIHIALTRAAALCQHNLIMRLQFPC